MSDLTILDFFNEDDLLTLLEITGKRKSSFDQLLKKLNTEIKKDSISITKLRKAWSNALSTLFFNQFQKMYSHTPSTKFDTTQKLKTVITKQAKIIAEKLKTSAPHNYITRIETNPLHYIYVGTFKEVDNFNSFLQLPLDEVFLISFLPELGLAISWPNIKGKKQDFTNNLLKLIFEKVTEIKINALLLRKYSTSEIINRLVISTPQEIAGFSGMDGIEFKGPNVVLGLSGLKRRHDADIDVITRVGPFTEIESDLISLICGKGVQFKNYEGIISLVNVLKQT